MRYSRCTLYKEVISTESLHTKYRVSVSGLVVRVPGYRSKGPCSIPDATRFVRSSRSETGSTKFREYNWGLLEMKSSGSGLEDQEYGRRGSVTLTTWHPLSTNVGTDFSDKRRSFGRYGSLADSGHSLFCLFVLFIKGYQGGQTKELRTGHVACIGRCENLYMKHVNEIDLKRETHRAT
jgi:hypothetical protein